ncbi:MAG: flagellar brake protein [Phycisphaerae bacterium]
MPTLKDLAIDEISEAFGAAAEKDIPVTLTVRDHERWATHRSRFVAIGDTHLVIQMPIPGEGVPVHEFVPAEKAGLSFKLRHHKYICTVTVVGQIGDCDESGDPALRLCWPTWMQKMQRRAFQRAEVPQGRFARAAFWAGSGDDEPTNEGPERPVWTGRIKNISAGGFQMITDHAVADAVEMGEPVGVRLSFGTARSSIYVDAQVRHIAPADSGALVGFQFVGLGQTDQGRHVLQEISSAVSDFQRFVERTAGARA